MNPANLINGQKPEFGNPEHIQFLNERRKLEEMKKGGEAPIHSANIDEKTVYDFYIRFTCLNCAKEYRYREYDLDDAEQITVKCKCGQRYDYDHDNQTLTIEK